MANSGSTMIEYMSGLSNDWSQDFRRGETRFNEEQAFHSTTTPSLQQTVYHPIFGSVGTKTFPSLVKKSPSGGYVIPTMPSDHGYNSLQSQHSSACSTNCRDEYSLTLAGTASTHLPNSLMCPTPYTNSNLHHMASLPQFSQFAANNPAFLSMRPPTLLPSHEQHYPYNRRDVKQQEEAVVNGGKQKPGTVPAVPMASLLGAGDFNTSMFENFAAANNAMSRRSPGAPSDITQFINGHESHQDEKEVFARKVFVGGLPIDVKEEEIYQTFSHFGPVLVDWPRRPDGKEASSLVQMTGYNNASGTSCHSDRYMTGYVFLVFEDEKSVQHLVSECHQELGRYYLFVSSPTMRDKPVQVRPWRLSDMDHCPVPKMSMCPRRTVFIGGVPRPTKASELAEVLENIYGSVCYVGIDIDPELKYPKGAARVTFATTQSFVAAINGRFVHIPHAENQKRVEIKPYVMDEQMCDECEGRNCSARYAPYFCGDVTCLQYYCEVCWDNIHYNGQSKRRSTHKPLVRLGDQTKLLARPPHHNFRNGCSAPSLPLTPSSFGMSRPSRGF